ncbi:MAG: hypothetical protein MUE41_10365 [Gemmatimonadaceae bacterium]|nr:hypothetical protein [Gemmatimonadaceae bacterium]
MMTRASRLLLPGAVLAVSTLAACNTGTTDPDGFGDDPLAAAFATTPLGFANSDNSFASGAEGMWGPPMFMGGTFRGGDRGGPPFGMMGGGLGADFFGGVGFGVGRDGRGPGPRERGGPFGDGALPAECAFNATSQRNECAPVTRDGITTTRSAQYRTAANGVQQAYDTGTTHAINTQVGVSGTTTRVRRSERGSAPDTATSTIRHRSTRTVVGLSTGSTRRTIDGASAGQETTTGRRDGTPYTSTRIVGDTTRGLVIPVSATGPSFPTAGTVIRQMKVTLVSGGNTTTSERREVVTYDGSNTAKVTITRNGETRQCTIELPRGRPNCS